MEENKQVEQHHVDTSHPFTSVKKHPSTCQTAKLVSTSISQIAKPVSHIASPSISHTTKPASPIAASSRLSHTAHTASLSSSPRNQRISLPYSPQGSKEEFMEVLKKLEAEITETKTEVRMLKERVLLRSSFLGREEGEYYQNISY
ncbi:hypothetical protein HID58_013456 [Brassica napus]|uniref:Uncharacterized protein n=1 Tax=Brassica napus TaxID=3708 RepID=A0ABQ8E410_BRANA|nr:hypothetical protein HID58_013456 [Brassica napus]